MPQINWNMVATLVIASVVVLLLKKLFVTETVGYDGTTDTQIGVGEYTI